MNTRRVPESSVTGIFVCMAKKVTAGEDAENKDRLKKARMRSARAEEASDDADEVNGRGATMLSVIVACVIIAIAALQFIQVLGTYMQSKSELDAAKEEQVELQNQKNELEEELGRWNDNAYVEAQARSRLGFVFPGERSVHLTNTGREQTTTTPQTQSTKITVPWYTEVMYSLEKSDQGDLETDATVGGALGQDDTTRSDSSDAAKDATQSTTDPSSTATAGSDGDTTGTDGTTTME